MKRTLAAVSTLAALSACTVGPDYVRPETPIPARWSESRSAAANQTPLNAWWKTFNDPMLDRLIDEAVVVNPDLKQAVQRIRYARTQRTQAVASGLPSLGAQANVSRRLNSITSSGGTSGTVGGGTFGGGAFGFGNRVINIFQAGLDAQWELDLFGGIRRTVEAAEATIEAEEDNRRALLVSLLGEVAAQYINVRANQQQLAVIEENLLLQQDALHLTQERQRAGLASTLDVAQAEAQAEATAAQRPVYRNQIRQAVHALGILLDRAPGELAPRLEPRAAIPHAAQPAAADLPSELLRRRPDIRAAERSIAAANAEIGAAVAAQYPRVNLAAFLGFQNSDIADFTMLGKSWSMASTLAFPIFNWGSVKANIEGKKARHEELLFAYRSTVLNAFKEVEDALSALEQETQRLAQLKDSQAAENLAFELARERYLKGLTGFLDVLTAERSLLDRRLAVIESQAKIAAQRVALYKALGGGWEVTESATQPRRPRQKALPANAENTPPAAPHSPMTVMTPTL